jgi:hypothetical protein
MAGQHPAAITYSQTYERAHKHVSEVMLADEYAAGGDQCRPGQGGYGKRLVCVPLVVPESDYQAYGEGESIGRVGGEESEEASPALQYREPLGQHPVVIARPQAVHRMLHDVRKLVAQGEGDACRCDYDKGFLPSQTPEKEISAEDVGRNPHRLV